VAEILEDTTAGWAEVLRDRLGLGHYDPGASGHPIEILVMRYTVEEVLTTQNDSGHPAIPTVLDGELSAFFFPSPVPAPGADPSADFGRTVNLSPVATQNDYELGCELIHPRLAYRPEHCLRTGVIARPVAMPLEQARAFHLPWVRLYSERDDYGAGTAT
jgi:hypothetical protein